jgi:hypothetical protein
VRILSSMRFAPAVHVAESRAGVVPVWSRRPRSQPAPCTLALLLATVAIGVVVLVAYELPRRALEARERRRVKSRPVLQ